MQLLQFFADCFETSQMFWSWSEDMPVVWILPLDYLLPLFVQFELSFFHALLLSTYVDNGYFVRISPL